MRKTFEVHTALHDALLKRYLELISQEKGEKIYSTDFYKRMSQMLGKYIHTELESISKPLFQYYQRKSIDTFELDYTEISGLGYKTILRAFPENKKGFATKQLIELVGYFSYGKQEWDCQKSELGPHRKRSSDNILEKRNVRVGKMLDNTDFKSIVSSFLFKEHKEQFIIEQDKLIQGISSIRREVDFYLLSLSEKVKFEWIIDCVYTDSKIGLESVEGVLAKQNDCRVHKSGVITNIGFDETATKYGLENKIFMAVIPMEPNNNIEYVSRLREKKHTNDFFMFVLSPKGEINMPIVHPILQNKILQRYFKQDAKEVNNADFEVCQIKSIKD